ncbi:MAG: outer membrane beta-barrel protein [Chitinispirillales bacterium]|jgi:hypothetical protein|nr:outer membrane beta-barrel protein [Chitinispirillales bacterium]
MKHVKWLFSVLTIMAACTLSFAQDAKRVYLGVRLGVGVGLSRPLGDLESFIDYYDAKWNKGGASFDVAPFVSLQIVDAFALQTEMLVTKWGGGYSDEEETFDFKRSALIIPLLAKFTFHPSNFVIQAFLGPHITANIGKWNVTYTLYGIEEKEKWSDKELLEEFGGEKINYPPIGITGGIGFGVKAGPGNVFVDARFITDAGVISQDVPNFYVATGEKAETKKENFLYRAKLSFTVGYEFGLGNR